MLSLKALLICFIIATIPVLAEPDDVITTSDGKMKGKIDPSLRDLQACKFVYSSTTCVHFEAISFISSQYMFLLVYRSKSICC